jgi:hypothetical protein
MKVIFAIGNSGTKHLVVDQLIKAYSDAKCRIHEQLLGVKVQDVGLYYESTVQKTIAYINDYIKFYQDEYDVLIMSGWEINKHIHAIFNEYRDRADFICIRLNEEYTDGIEQKHFSNSWDQSPEHRAVKQQMTETLESFYLDKTDWFVADLEPEIKNFKIVSAQGAHKIAILSTVNK